MKTFKSLVNEIYEPNTPDTGKFINMHTIRTFDYPVKNDHGLPFRDDRIKAPGPQHKKPATYEPPHEPARVYKSANELKLRNENVELRKQLGLNPNEQELFEVSDIMSLLQVVSDYNHPTQIFFEDNDPITIDKDLADLLLNAYGTLDEDSQDKFERALVDSESGFEYCVNFSAEGIEQ